jgi:arylsulfatase A-like enzyme
MSDVFLGRSTAAGRPAPLFWSRPPDRPGPAKNTWPDFAIRDGKWKLLVHAAKSPELYDIAADPGEMINESETNPQVVAGLTAKLAVWRKAVNCEEIYKPNRATDPGFRD